MLPLTEESIRASLVNASQRERKELTLPKDFDSLAWGKIDFLAWRDPKLSMQGYVVVHLDGELVGIVLRQSDGRLGAKAQCSWCEDVQLPNEVVFFSAKRAGAAGRKGDTVGSLVCAHFECSRNVRKQPTMAYIGFDVEAERLRRIDVLLEHAQNFVRGVRDGD
jgi:hypothetical protein